MIFSRKGGRPTPGDVGLPSRRSYRRALIFIYVTEGRFTPC
jgi:hypothetical protein